jgi:protein-S-isoprenylcysteine O-methyltransferase Ste14
LFRTRYLWVGLLLFPLGWAIEPSRLSLALPISLFGQGVQTWCFASLVKNRELTIRGPYVLCRNPMYVGRYFVLLGFVSWVGRGWLTVGLIVLYTAGYYLYMVSRVQREERRLDRVFGEAYARYRREVPRFVPALSNVGNPALRYWDWGPFHENNAHWNIVATLGAYAAIWLIHFSVPSPW